MGARRDLAIQFSCAGRLGAETCGRCIRAGGYRSYLSGASDWPLIVDRPQGPANMCPGQWIPGT